MADKYIKNYINGALVPAMSGAYMDTVNPATGKVYAQLPRSNANDLEQAVEAAERMLPEWSGSEPERRFRILMRIADILEQNMGDFARAETVDTGKPLSMSVSHDVPDAQACFRYYATGILHQETTAQQSEKSTINMRLRQPVGIVGCIVPWQLPLYLLCHKIAPALAAGNCVIAKVSQYAPMTAYLLAQACIEAGLPTGVLNIVHGEDEFLTPLIVEHPSIRAISYSGDFEMGQAIIEKAAPKCKKLSLDMGGNNVNIIFGDCSFDQMMIGTLRSSFSNNGHLSEHASRILVERSLYDQLKNELVKRTQFLKIGDPFSSITDLGAVISETQVEKIKSYLTLVEVEGGKVLCGGKRVETSGELELGYFMRPAIVEGLPNDAQLNQAPIWGPIVTLQAFDTLDDAIKLANASVYGRCASVWTKDTAKANTVAERLHVGTVWINAWRNRDITVSARGRGYSSMYQEGGADSLRFFTEEKTIAMKY